MHCRELENLAGELLEGEAHPEAAGHLAACPACRVLVEELRSIERAAHTLPAYEPSDELWRRLEAAATREGVWAQTRPWGWLGLGESFFPARWALAGAMAVVLLVAAGLLTYPTLEFPLAATQEADLFQVAQGELVQEASYTSRYEIHLQNLEDGVLEGSGPRESSVRNLVARPLDAVERAIEETQAQLNNYPDDEFSREELLRLYQQKAAVLQVMTDPARYEDAR